MFGSKSFNVVILLRGTNGGGGGTSCAIDVPCNLKYVDIFGFISIPVMAGTAFLTIFISLLYYDYARREHIE